ncbi:MAG TPA: family 1 glycosylhydrolase [Acidimicrobiales bacterium]
MTERTDPRWGAAVTASGSLGVSPTSDWGRWVADGRLPASADGSGFGVDFAADLALLAELGLSRLRWTIDWSRLEPRPGRWNTDAADLVTEVLRAARTHGIEVWAVLHEGPLPGWFAEDERGFRDDAGLRRTWPRHVDRVAEEFGDLVAAWVPVLDPSAIADHGNLTGSRPPGRQDEAGFLAALRDLHLASYEAMRLLRSGDPSVACCIDAEPVHDGVRSREPDERDAARSRAATIDRLRFGTWVRALRDGVLSIPGGADVELEGLATGYDVVGLTYRGATTVYADGSLGPYPADAPVAADGHAPWAEGLGVVVRRLADELPGRRLAVLGTGLTDAADEWRVELLHQTATEIGRAAADHVGVTEVFWETVVDGWTPECGLAVPDGVVTRGREWRASAEVLHAVADGRGMLTT